MELSQKRVFFAPRFSCLGLGGDLQRFAFIALNSCCHPPAECLEGPVIGPVSPSSPEPPKPPLSKSHLINSLPNSHSSLLLSPPHCLPHIYIISRK